MKTSTNYQFNLPSWEDSADVTQLTENWQKLDGLFRALRQAIAITEGTLDSYTDVNMYVYSAGNSQNIANVPEKAQSTMLVLPRLLPDDPQNRVQIIITQTNNLYIRNYTGGTWEKWSQYRKDIVPIEYGGTGATDVTNARKKFGLPEQCVTITDWNEVTKTGWYMANNAANAPTTGWYFGFVLVHASGYLFQEVYQFTASKEAIAVPKYIRAKTNDQWGEWYNVTVQRNVPKDAKLDYIKTLTEDAQTQFNNIYTNKMDVKPGFIELTPAKDTDNGGYIDFHYEGSEDDYTARLIEEQKGVLLARAVLKVESDLYENGSNRVFSKGNLPTPNDINGVMTIAKGGTGASSKEQARKNLGLTSGVFYGNGGSLTFDTGAGVGSNIIFISGWSAKGYLTPMGGVMFHDKGGNLAAATYRVFGGNSGNEAKYENGILTINHNSDYLNVSGGQFYYYCV